MSLRVGIAGAGYIADFHARVLKNLDKVRLMGICDPNAGAARSFASTWNVPRTFTSIEAMLAEQQFDVVHVLAPPNQHRAIADVALRSGAHVFLEKPMCLSASEADQLLQLAREHSLMIGVNHNFLYSHAYEILRESIYTKRVGVLQHVTFNYFLELPQLLGGPFDAWMFREPGNVFLEVGPHLVAAMLDLVGEAESISATADRPITVPGGATVYRRWLVRTIHGRTVVDMNIDFSPGFSSRTISARGHNGIALADLDANTCMIDKRTTLSLDFDRFSRTRSLASQLRSHAAATFADYLLTVLKIRKRGGPYQVSFNESIRSFYKSLDGGAPLDSRISGDTGRRVIKFCERIIEAANTPAQSGCGSLRSARKILEKPTVIVLGGSGFIGRALIGQLLAANYCVRAVSHRSGSVLADIKSDRLEVVRASVNSKGDLISLMDGVDYVFHLARAPARTWDEYVTRDVEPTRLIAEACLEAGVKRLVYTGTIASYYTGRNSGTIDERTPLDPMIHRREHYARAKAAAEALLLEMFRTKKLPVVVVRPGIVIGEHGTPFHWGVGMWTGDSVCQVWGDGKNKLPFVLVGDVAAALLRTIQVDGIEGRSYNLVDEPLLTARDYLYELERRVDMSLDIRYSPIFKFYLTDLTKWLVKMAVRHPDRNRIPSYRDWESRTHKAIFDCSRARSELGWTPASDQKRLVDEGIAGALKDWLLAM